jgi:hypothetical protein
LSDEDAASDAHDTRQLLALDHRVDRFAGRA